MSRHSWHIIQIEALPFMKPGCALIQACLLGALLLLAVPAVVQAQFNFTTNNGAITITKYTGSGGAVNIPSTTNGYPVTTIGNSAFGWFSKLTSVTIPNSVTNIADFAFYSCTNLTSLMIPDSVISIGNFAFSTCTNLANLTIGTSVTSIGSYAFGSCSILTAAYFQGNAPPDNGNAFYADTNATVYYLPGTKGWGATFGSRPTKLWNPQAQTSDASFGVQTNQFGFNITGSSNLVIVVEACADLANPAWIPVGTNTLNTYVGTNGTSYFSDPQWTNYPGRFYRFRSP